MYRDDCDGMHHEMRLGPMHVVDLATAGVKAEACRATLLAGQDPLAEKRRTEMSA